MSPAQQSTIDIDKAYKLASLKIVKNNDDELLIRSKFDFFNKSNFGMLLFLIIGLICISLTLTHADDLIDVLIGLLFGIGLTVFSLLGLFKQTTDYVKLTSNELEFSNSLKKEKSNYLLSSKIKISARTERQD